MATDVARLSFDPARGYRGVVPQQGRVSLEAEQNEQRVLDVEERRQELIDIVGPAGTPDDGYAISGETGFDGGTSSGFEITVGAGTMYVGGWRVELETELGDYHQPDWLDRGRDWAETGREHVVLMVEETDVTAVEDPALYEVALGGPDGSARTRLLQRILRLKTEGATCAEALSEDWSRWIKQGLHFDPATMALQSSSRLQVGWEGDPAPANPCEPSSTGGYLGAENQLIRIQITKVGKDGGFDFVWGYDGASALYRVTADASANPVLTLDRTPVDDYHRPRAGQAVQALRATAELRSADGVVEGYVAALADPVGVLAAPYDPDTKTVQFPTPLPAGYTDPDENPQLYLRIWEELVTGAQAGTPVSLTGTGLQITISAAGEGDRLHVDDFWCVGVRPSTPTTVYPERYLRAPQPPDGPRRWVCPLAVIEWQAEPEKQTRLVVLEDCRRHFRPLTEQESDDGCCTIEVHPSDAASDRLQELIDRAAEGRSPAHRDSHVTICFAPGRYELRNPLVLRRRHSNITLSSCSEAAVIAADPDSVEAFGQGLFVLADVDNVTITGFEFVLPQVPAAMARHSGGGLFDRAAVHGVNEAFVGRWLSFGIRMVDCAVIEVSDCLFRYSLGEHETTPEVEQTMPRSVFAVGLLLSGGSWGLRVLGNRFLHHPTASMENSQVTHVLAGLLHMQNVAAQTHGGRSVRRLGSASLPAIVEDALISGNVCDGISAGFGIVAQLGSVRISDNVIRNVVQGITILDAQASTSPDTNTAGRQLELRSAEARQAHATMASASFDPVLAYLMVLGATVPLPDLPDFHPAGLRHIDPDNVAELRAQAAEQRRSAAIRTARNLAAEHPAAEEAEDAADRGSAKAQASSTAQQPVADAALTMAEMATNSGLSSGMLAALRQLEEFSTIVSPQSTLTSAISVEGNTVDCTSEVNGLSSWALLVTMYRTETGGATAIISNNRLTSVRPPYIAGISTLAAVTVTGNIIGVVGIQTTALAIGNVAAAAITGNVVMGRCVLPANRPFEPPLDTWLPMNTIL